MHVKNCLHDTHTSLPQQAYLNQTDHFTINWAFRSSLLLPTHTTKMTCVNEV